MASFFAIAISLSLIFRQIRLQRQANLLHTLGEMDKRWNSKELLSARIHEWMGDNIQVDDILIIGIRI